MDVSFSGLIGSFSILEAGIFWVFQVWIGEIGDGLLLGF